MQSAGSSASDRGTSTAFVGSPPIITCRESKERHRRKGSWRNPTLKDIPVCIWERIGFSNEEVTNFECNTLCLPTNINKIGEPRAPFRIFSRIPSPYLIFVNVSLDFGDSTIRGTVGRVGTVCEL